jgi:hypothetical protein
MNEDDLCCGQCSGSRPLAQRDSFGESAVFPGLATAQPFPLPMTVRKQSSERTAIHECLGSHCRSDETTDRPTEKWFPGMLLKAL